MKVMILSTKTGEGHNSASKAVAESLRAMGCEVILMDLLRAGRRDVSRRVSALYTGITTLAPWLMAGLYNLGGLVSSSRRHSPIYYLNTLYWRSLVQKISDVRPDVILCPHIFSAQAITFLKLRHGLKTPAVGLDTDYTCSPFWEETWLDCYIVPAPEVAVEFAKKGVPAEKIVPIGIPVDAAFTAPPRRMQARQAFGLTAERVFVVMGGSMGFGRILSLSEAILARMPDAQVALVCAENMRLLEKARQKAVPGLVPFGYVENIPLLMDAADVLLTKPGGLSSSEAMQKRVPVIFTDPIPDGEEQNARFIGTLGAGLSARGVRASADLAVALMRDPARREAMRQAQAAYFPNDVSLRVARLLIETAGAEAPGLRCPL